MEVDDEFAVGSLPLHLTVLPRTRVSAGQYRALVDDLIDQGRTTPGPIVVVGVAREVFGRDVAVLVTTVDVPTGLVDLHRDLLACARQSGAVPVVPEFTGDGYRPHITPVGDDAVSPGETVVLPTLAVIDCSTSLRRVVATVALA